MDKNSIKACCSYMHAYVMNVYVDVSVKDLRRAQASN
jgi:hypothetical protein